MNNEVSDPKLHKPQISIPVIPVIKKVDFRVGVIFLVLSGFVIFESNKMPRHMPGVSFGPGIMPLWLGVVLAVLSVILLWQSVNVKNVKTGIVKREEVLGVGVLFLTLVLYMVIMEFVGFALDTFLLVTFLARRLGKYAYWKCALLGAITGGLTVYLFRILLEMPLPIGFLGF
ncbi:MAG: tripartite tricarboxylate transporter TctB family protein [Desulfitobacteriaceae bacterium]|nr:tripartite tricarboxylate transporter TctB family protein [Desulfitobacteriaceae bacterium]MDI6914069.1 tripartite tricarboxylate transporter TctB family protein [Desulfitobacteriaceae bacterium]